MSYQMGVTGAELATLHENGDILIVVPKENTSVFFLDDVEDKPHIQRFPPTVMFWKALIEVNELTANISEYHSQADVYNIRDVTPDVTEFDSITAPQLPKYEERILWAIYFQLLRLRENTNVVFTDHPSLRRLVRAAHVETGQKVPEYLTDYHNE